MKNAFALLLLALTPIVVWSQPANHPATEKITVEQLTTTLSADAGKSDAEIAADLATLELTERLDAARFDRLMAPLPGVKSKQALTVLADSAEWLQPPPAAIVDKPAPDAATLRQMLVSVVNYANVALHGLPNFVAARETTAFEDRPKEDVQESLAVVSYSYLPLHPVHQATAEVTYRDGHEVLNASGKTAASGAASHGLETAGEFGPFLSTVLADAVKGKIMWAQWEQGIDAANAVFRYTVPKETSHYVVRFCCIREDSSESIATHVYSEKTAYHGEITFDPASGAVLRITVEADLPAAELVERAGMMVQYAAVPVGAKSVVLPQKSVSLLKAHTTAPPAGMHMAEHKGPPKTFLNDVSFSNYHQYRGEMRILTADDGKGTVP